MIRAATCLLLSLPLTVGQGARENAPPRVATPELLAIEMARALVSEDLERITALAATREEMETMLETAWPPATADDREYIKTKVAEILAERVADLERFQAMKKASGVNMFLFPRGWAFTSIWPAIGKEPSNE